MPLFGNKKKIDLPEVVDFSNDTWSFKGTPPVYQIQSDGFTYDIVDADGNDKNAISLGIAGMLVIVLNAKSPKIKENELLPHFGKVIKTRNWHSMTVKEANFLVQTAIKKLTNSSTSGDVFDLASYAPLEIKRVLLKTLFTISRMQLPPECREEAEHRVIDDIVPDIFANPDYELASLTGLIVKSDEKSKENISSRLETAPIIENELPFSGSYTEEPAPVSQSPAVSAPEPDSAFAELQRIYGRRIDTPQVRANIQQQAPAAAVTGSQQAEAGNPVSQTPAESQQQNNPFAAAEPISRYPVQAAPVSAPQPANPFNTADAASMNRQQAQDFSASQAKNPFASSEPRSIPQPSAPNFGTPQPNNPFAANQPGMPYQQNIPQPPVPNNMQQGNFPFGRNSNQPIPNQMNMQGNPFMGNFQPYPQQMMQQNQPVPPAGNAQNYQQMPYLQQGWQQNYPAAPNMQGYPQNPNQVQTQEGNNLQNYPGWQNRPQNYNQPPQQNQQNN